MLLLIYNVFTETDTFFEKQNLVAKEKELLKNLHLYEPVTKEANSHEKERRLRISLSY